MKDITIQEAYDLRQMARQAFRNSIGATEDDAAVFDHRNYTVLDLNFLWHFQMLIEEQALEKAAKACENLTDHYKHTIATEQCASVIRGLK